MQQVMVFSKLLVFFEHFHIIFPFCCLQGGYCYPQDEAKNPFFSTGYNLKLVTCGKRLSKRFALRKKKVHEVVAKEQR